MDKTYATSVTSPADNGSGFQAIRHYFYIVVRDGDNRLRASEILHHVIHGSSIVRNQGFHISRVLATELVDVLVIVTDRYDPHILIATDKFLDQSEFLLTKVLCLVDDKD